MAIAGDQGGSIRMPSSFCGNVGLKPTFGLVPYTGAYPIEWTIDHLGPIARNMTDLAAFLTAIAGPDGHDPRQAHAPVGNRLQRWNGRRNRRTSRSAWSTEGFGYEGLSDPGRRRAGGGGRQPPRRSGSAGRDGLDSRASRRHPRVECHRHRRGHVADDPGQRLRHELSRPVRPRVDGAHAERMEEQRPRDVVDAEVRHALRRAHHRAHRGRCLRPSLQRPSSDQCRRGRGAGLATTCCATRRCRSPAKEIPPSRRGRWTSTSHAPSR